jgi:hypothetical protein
MSRVFGLPTEHGRSFRGNGTDQLRNLAAGYAAIMAPQAA